MKRNNSISSGGFNNQMITDYFQDLVIHKKIKNFKVLHVSNVDLVPTYRYEFLIRKKWNHICSIVVSKQATEYFKPSITSHSRSSTLLVHVTESSNMPLVLIKKIIDKLLVGASAEKRVVDIVNNQLFLENNATLHCFPASDSEDIRGVDINLYLRITPSSNVIKIPVQIKHTASNSMTSIQHMERFPQIPIVFTKNASDESIMLQIVAIVNNRLKMIHPSN